MRKLCYLIACLSSMVAMGQGYQILDYNGVRAHVYADGILFNDTFNHVSSFEVPKGGDVHSIYISNLWLAGQDLNGQLRLSANPYSSYGVFSPGPIELSYDSAHRNIWKIHRSMIENHRNNWNVSGYVVPSEIASWPGNGKNAGGQREDLAPFVDWNVNGIYDPEFGDYPCVRGDQAVYAIYNDVASRDTSKGEGLGVEIHLMAYQFAENSPVNNTVFVNYKIINRSALSYQNFRIGSFADGDVGCSHDDFLGCDTVLNTIFYYNGDGFDEDCGSSGYGSIPPACGTVFLGDNMMSSFIYYSNGIGPFGEPLTLLDYHNYLNGRWLDGSQITVGGQGYGGTVPINYVYPGDPLDKSQWSDIVNVPNERRGVATVGPYNFPSGDTIDLDLAFVWSRSLSASLFSSVPVLKDDVILVREYFDALDFCAIPTGKEELTLNNQVGVFPNPVHDKLSFNFGAQKPAYFYLVNALGQRLTAPKTPVNSIDVGLLVPGVYIAVFDWGTHVSTERFSVQ